MMVFELVCRCEPFIHIHILSLFVQVSLKALDVVVGRGLRIECIFQNKVFAEQYLSMIEAKSKSSRTISFRILDAFVTHGCVTIHKSCHSLETHFSL